MVLFGYHALCIFSWKYRKVTTQVKNILLFLHRTFRACILPYVKCENKNNTKKIYMTITNYLIKSYTIKPLDLFSFSGPDHCQLQQLEYLSKQQNNLRSFARANSTRKWATASIRRSNSSKDWLSIIDSRKHHQ